MRGQDPREHRKPLPPCLQNYKAYFRENERDRERGREGERGWKIKGVRERDVKSNFVSLHIQKYSISRCNSARIYRYVLKQHFDQ